MGYDVALCVRDVDEDGNITRKVVHAAGPHREGSNIACTVVDGELVATGTYACEMTVTYNYSEFYYRVFGEKGFRRLDGMTGKQSQPLLSAGLIHLGNDRDPDYWKATAGNAGHILEVMLDWANAYPDAYWDVE